MRFGTEEQKSFFLPAILAGEVNFAIGYTEPEAGTDLASLRTRAVRDGDEYVVNGAKVFTSGADMADYIWLAVRTDPDAPKHKGISILLRAHRLARASRGAPSSPWPGPGPPPPTTPTSASRSRHLVGDENEGWRMITTQLNHERVGLAAWSGFASQLYEEVGGVGGETPPPTAPSVLDLGLGAGRPGPVPGRARGHVPPQLAHGHRAGGRHHEPGRLLDGEGVRRRAQHRHLPPPARDRGRRRLPRARTRPGRCWPAASSAPPATPRSTPSAAGSTRSSARSWPWPAWA